MQSSSSAKFRSLIAAYEAELLHESLRCERHAM
ncbi:hypothetical protein RLDS_21475 [Sphingobium lactosutens DS20]|uniref:Uncharacterized protein n=1 Tax=Sphingobium lactosutens DS20 TaxID=1331060 RepID=T0IPX4_9SPHN|nr:hypothetical protein RLDS_21475 [Sphingobium lactosutens DS20]